MENNIKEFMAKAGCEKWPERWETFFAEVVEDFDKNGLEVLDEEYYDRLHDKYGIINSYMDAYKTGAREVKKDRGLSIFLALLCRAMKDREHIISDTQSMSLPKVPDGINPVGRNMLCGLAICSGMDYCYKTMSSRGIPPEMIRVTMNKPEGGVAGYVKNNNGEYGYSLFDWYQHAIDGRLINIGRLEIEFITPFWFSAEVYSNGNGEYTALAKDVDIHRSGYILGTAGYENTEGSWHADITEDSESIKGYKYMENGLVECRPTILEKKIWKKVLSSGDKVIGLHIPAKGRLEPRLVDETLRETKEFIKKYYPDINHKAFVCCSWLLDPQIKNLLGEDSNITKFLSRFNHIAVKDEGKAVFSFVYGKTNPVIEELPEETRLHKAFKNHFLNGRRIYCTGGFFFDE